MLTSGSEMSAISIVWYELALRASIATTVSLMVTLVGFDQLTFMEEPAVSSTPSPLVSQWKPDSGICPELFGV